MKNIVLVHGAWADGSGWQGVYDSLRARGYNVSIVQNPVTSLAHDVEAVDRIVDRLEKEGGRFSVLMSGIVESVPFQMRRNAK